MSFFCTVLVGTFGEKEVEFTFGMLKLGIFML
jgi:hypothetical protein